jgi:TolB protein
VKCGVRLFLSLFVFYRLHSTASGADIFLESRRLGHEKIPVAVLPFSGTDGETISLAETTLRADLSRSGWFEVVRLRGGIDPLDAAKAAGAMAVISATVSRDAGRIELLGVAFETGAEEPEVNVKLGGEVQGDRESVRQTARGIAHRFADKLVAHFTGEAGVAQTRLVFVSDSTGQKELYVIDYDGENEQRLTGEQSIILSPHWSSDATKIAYTSYRSGNPAVYLLDMNTGQRKSFLSYKGLTFPPVWPLRGERIAFASSQDGNSEIYTLRPEGTDLKRLTTEKANDLSPTWSVGGRQIAFTSDRGGHPQIYVMEADGSNLHRLTFTGDYNTSPAWSPKGDRITYVCRNPEKRLNICLIGIDGQRPVQITEEGPYDNESPAWSPNGQEIAFSSNRIGKSQIFSIRLDGTGLTRLTKNDSNNTSPAWSPR